MPVLNWESNIDFSYQVVDSLLDYMKHFGECQFEKYFEYKIQFEEFDVLLRMFVDGVYGNNIFDHKTKVNKKFKANTYLHSLQWRCYLMATGAQKFTYNLFELKEKGGLIDGISIDYLDLYPDDTMVTIVREYAYQCATFVLQHNIKKRIFTT